MLSQRLEARTESFSSVLAGQTARSVEFTKTVSESSSVSWRTVEIQMEMETEMQSVSSVESIFDTKLSASPKLLMEMSDVQVQSGEMAEFSCSFDGQPFTGVVWDHNGRSVADTERVKSSQIGGLLSLVIKGVGVADQGRYCCTASNQHGHNCSSAQLTVEGG